MKIRQGFVSNSSSTSFCIYGIWVDHPEEKLINLVEEMKLSRHYNQYGDGFYIGREWSSIGDDETGKQFRENIQEKINNLPVDNKKCETYEEGWFDG